MNKIIQKKPHYFHYSAAIREPQRRILVLDIRDLSLALAVNQSDSTDTALVIPTHSQPRDLVWPVFGAVIEIKLASNCSAYEIELLRSLFWYGAVQARVWHDRSPELYNPLDFLTPDQTEVAA